MFRVILTIGIIQALAVFLQLLKSKITAVYLGPVGVGVIGTIDQLVQAVAFMISLGLTESATKFLSKAHSESFEDFKISYAVFLKLLFWLSITGVVVSSILVFWYPDILGKEIKKYQLYLFLALLTVPAYILGLYFTRVLAAAQKTHASSILTLITNSVTLTGVTLGILTAGLAGFYLGILFSGILLTVGSIIYLNKRLKLNSSGESPKKRQEIKLSPEVTSFTAMLYFVSITNSISYFVARYTVLSGFGEAEAGFLHAVFALSLVIGLILNPVVKLYFTPIVNRNTEKALKIQRSVEFQRKMIFLLLLAALPIVLFPQLTLTILFSPQFAVRGQVVFLFVMAQFIFQVAYMNLTLLIGLDDLKSYTVVYLCGQLIFALLCIFLVPVFGISGVSYGLIVSSLFILFLTLLRLIQNHGFSGSFNLYLLFLYALSVLYLVGLESNRIDEEWSLFITLIKAGVFLLVVISLFFFLNKSEKKSLYKLKDRLISGKNAEI